MSEFGIGQSAKRVEDARFLTGAGRYVDDISLGRQAYAFILRSPHASADITSIDTAKAGVAPGVLLVLTGKDAEEDGLGGIPCTQMKGDGGWLPGHATHQPVLTCNTVRHVGERVALVIAETLDQAKDAAELIEITYAPLPFTLSARDAGAADAPQVWQDAAGNICFETQMGDGAAVEKALSEAHYVQKLSLHNQRIAAVPIEPRATLGAFERGRFTLYTSCQKPHTVRQVLANAVFRRAETDFHVICPDVGGGFGLRGTVYPEDALVLWAAQKIGRPVKWTGERADGFTGDTHARDQMDVGEMAFDADGRITGFKAALTTNLGAYLSVSALVSTLRAAVNLSNVYAIPAIRVSARAVFSHTMPSGPYRGAGLPEAVHLVERLIDEAASNLGLGTAEIRRRNLIAPAAMPYKTALQYTYDSCRFEEVLDQSLAGAGYDGFSERRKVSEANGKLRGIGLGFYLVAITSFSERMEMRIDASGRATVLAGTFSYGQGHETVYAQMVSEWLGLPLDHVRVVQGDTDVVAFGRGSFGSRSMTMGGSALKSAADEVIEKGKKIAAHLMEASAGDVSFENGKFSVSGTDKSRSLAEVAAAAFTPVGLPPGSGAGLEASAVFEGPFNFPNGCHIAEVEIDPNTGTVEIANYTAIDEIGVAINPKLAEGQIHGGVVQGLGQALFEAVRFDEASGQLLSGSLMDYAVPRAADVPRIETQLMSAPTGSNPLGVKGAGENGSLAAPPAIINAILDAIRPLGVKKMEMPATPERIWRAIKGASGVAK
ncbi:MAG: xanthine dehydrogenase family protein molybdopterin-binding subunit [Rhodospirillales bacterium]|nr:xanthine dehydrogenase family protein molybdopterin-binding subunit [Rhodospirillales bacterium]